MELEYLYGGKPKKSQLETDIEQAENAREQALERAAERILHEQRQERLKNIKNIKDLSWREVHQLSEDLELRKEDNENTQAVVERIIETCNAMIPQLQKRGVSVAPLPEKSGTQNILKFLQYVASKMKEKRNPKPATDDDQYLNDELELTPYQNQSVQKGLRVTQCRDNNCGLQKNDELILGNDGKWTKQNPQDMDFELQDSIPELGLKKGESILITADGSWVRKPTSQLKGNPRYREVA